MLPFPSTAVGGLLEPGVASSRLGELRSRPRCPGEASFFYFDASFRRDAVKVLPGEYFVHDEDILVTTTLGSCIAACLWDRRRRVGGMNHFMLPEGTGAGPHAGRYGAYAMELLVSELVKRGATRSTMEAKVFGGGALISGMETINIGERNTSFVLDYLRTERIALVSKDVLDIHPRRVCFLPASGKAMVRRLVTADTTRIVALERAASSACQPPAASGATNPS